MENNRRPNRQRLADAGALFRRSNVTAVQHQNEFVEELELLGNLPAMNVMNELQAMERRLTRRINRLDEDFGERFDMIGEHMEAMTAALNDTTALSRAVSRNGRARASNSRKSLRLDVLEPMASEISDEQDGLEIDELIPGFPTLFRDIDRLRTPRMRIILRALQVDLIQIDALPVANLRSAMKSALRQAIGIVTQLQKRANSRAE